MSGFAYLLPDVSLRGLEVNLWHVSRDTESLLRELQKKMRGTDYGLALAPDFCGCGRQHARWSPPESLDRS